MRRSAWRSVVGLVPHGHGPGEAGGRRRRRLLLIVLALPVPGLAAFGAGLGRPPDAVLLAVAVLVACVGTALIWRITGDAQREKDALQRQLAEAELNRRRFTSELLVNLARRNQSMLHRQLEAINQLEESEEDPDALAVLFTLDHLATRLRRNAESLLVLSGEQPARVGGEPVALREVVRAAIAETEGFARVSVLIDERPAVVGHSVPDLTHLLAELVENAVRFSPPDTLVRIRMRPDHDRPGGQLLVVEDWGVGMPPEELVAANEILTAPVDTAPVDTAPVDTAPVDVDLAVAQRLGFHVVARLSARHGVRVSLSRTPGSGTTAVVALPPDLFEPDLPATGGGAYPVALPAAEHVPPVGTAVLAPPEPAGVASPEATPHELAVPVQRSEPAWFGEDASQYIGLRRRVPQSHLAPQLRSGPAGRPALPPAHVTGAAQALSRFHAGRRAAHRETGAQAAPQTAPQDGPPGRAWFEPAVPPPPDGEPGPGPVR